MSDNTRTLQLAAIVAGIGLVGYLLWQARGAAAAAVQGAAGAVTGDNAITRGATDASGRPVTAYVGAGIAGTVGAATNAASGGVLASVGNWIGDKLFDLVNPAPATPAAQAARPSTTSQATQYQVGGAAAGSGSGSFAELSTPDAWWPYGPGFYQGS